MFLVDMFEMNSTTQNTLDQTDLAIRTNDWKILNETEVIPLGIQGAIDRILVAPKAEKGLRATDRNGNRTFFLEVVNPLVEVLNRDHDATSRIFVRQILPSATIF